MCAGSVCSYDARFASKIAYLDLYVHACARTCAYCTCDRSLTHTFPVPPGVLQLHTHTQIPKALINLQWDGEAGVILPELMATKQPL